MSNDIDNLKSSFAILNSAFNNIKVGDSVSQASFDALKSEFYLVKAQVDLLETPSQDVTQVELDAVSAQITTINTSVASLSDKITALDSQMATAQADIATLKTAVAALQATTTPTTTPPTTTTAATPLDSLDVTITYLGGGVPLIDPLNNTTQQSLIFSMAVKNKSASTFTNVKYKLDFASNVPSANLAAPGYLQVATIGASTPIWTLIGISPFYSYISAPSVTINGSQQIEYLISLNVRLKDAMAVGSWYFYPQASIAN
jgi:outer membrane murein-binding lipoprotein Lpp